MVKAAALSAACRASFAALPPILNHALRTKDAD
jgi:hypothetical protein